MTKKMNRSEIATKKRKLLVERTSLALGLTASESEGLLMTGRRQSLRVNRIKSTVAEVLPELHALGWSGERYRWMSDGFTIKAGLDAVRDSGLFADGRVLIQNAASWLPVLMLDSRAGDKVLDVCAAPGGKTTHMAALSDNQADITANDNSRARLAKLRAMCDRLEADINRYTLFDAQQLARRLDGERYDKILLDAPCSGEGMMRLDRDKDFETWSVSQIKRLQQLQRKILVQAWQLLQPGGTLVYSTCTMAPEENEQVIDYALRRLDGVEIAPIEIDLDNRVPAVEVWNGKRMDPRVGSCLRLQPSQDVEAFFVCVLRKGLSSS